MNRPISKNLSVILTGLILLSVSCAPGACFEETEAFLRASLYDNITKKMDAPDSLSLYGLGKEEDMLYNKNNAVEIALLPLNASTGNCKFIIRINGISDTLEFKYSSYPHLVSKECGYTFFYNIDTPLVYTTNTIDYIFLNKGNITTSYEENIRIFY